ncbi:MAG TPA: glycerol-3-phosphate 1-O-acyltransferase PlsY [Chromatiaceae bacterium]|nr:glycerol-3-phosphate 1-O-acyltransferase PlsY [Chromatiaceae bacterium]HIB84558.1 glycerol-3-phosphate 1-O-acyltransferase PlsY [Chromatiaceae bacterium]HIN82142.1 glycerol-3-phosphate 1-O-acyltransferase [Chromatiales bacterium]HIO14372.1 glycerol-3-phosphate 1-O-acyltransferase [Chromatiales bacterium]HIO53866.1 glycerol-3-phosphate 1-O-acyltransferase [Chromatiales bacterium]
MPMSDILFVAFAYLCGSISSAILVCRLAGLPDPRSQGSGNPGATNVFRFGGKKAAAMTLFGDMLKGLLPMLLANLLEPGAALLAMVGLAAFLGHLYPVFFGFRGGKGVATTFGVLCGLHWQIGVVVAMIWMLMAALFRVSSLSALTATLFAPLVVWVQTGGSLPLTIAVTLISVMLFWRHRSNIRGLLAGSEGKFGSG